MDRTKDTQLKFFVKNYLPRIKRLYRPENLILFGSGARSAALTQDGLDLLIVSELFETMPPHERAPDVLGMLDAPFRIEAHCYTPAEFRTAKNETGLVKTALAEGVDLLPGAV